MPLSALIGAGGILGGALIGSDSASKAAKIQQAAANQAAQIQQNEFGVEQAQLAPYMWQGWSTLPYLAQAAGSQLIPDAALRQAMLSYAGSPYPGIFGAESAAVGPTFAQSGAYPIIGGNYAAMLNAIGPTFQASPGYQFARQQGMDAITSQAAARGGIGGGGTMQALQQYGTGLANQDYGNWLQNFLGTMGNYNTAITGAYNNWLANTLGINQNQLASLAGYQGMYLNQGNQGYNNLFNLANLGENAAARAGAGAIQTGANVANTLQTGAGAAAAGQIGAGNALAGGLQSLGGMAAGGAFNNLGSSIGNLFSGLFSGPSTGVSPTDLATLQAQAYSSPTATAFAPGASPSNFQF